MFPLAGIAQGTVGENHAFGIETEIAINVVLLRKVNPMNGIRMSLRTATFPEKEDPFGLSPDSEKGIRGKCRKCDSVLRRIMEAVVAHFEHVAGVLLLFLLVLVPVSYTHLVEKMTPLEFTARINDEMFNDQDNWVRAIELPKHK